MNKLKQVKIILIILGLFLSYFAGKSQNIQFSQFYSSPTNLGPSFAGLIDGARICVNYRNQWPSIPGSFITYAVSYDQWFDKLKSGMGILIVRDQAGNGNLSLTDIGVLYSYDIPLDQKIWHFRPGLHFKVSQRGIDFQKLIFGDQIGQDGTINPSTIEIPSLSSTTYLDMATSFLFYSPVYWGGLTIDHLLTPNQSLTGDKTANVPLKFSLYGGMKIPISTKSRRAVYNEETENLTFAFNYRTQGGYDQMDLGAYWSRNPFVLGLWFRGLPVIRKASQSVEKLDAIIVLVGYKIASLSFGYSYDFTINKLISSTGGSNEISLVYEFTPVLKSKRKHAVISCPKF